MTNPDTTPTSSDVNDAFVSVIIPTYNSATVLPDAINSVLDQTRSADELIIVDDGSNDDTAATCERYGDRLRLLRQPNQGASTARNTGIAEACASHADAADKHWLAFLDADDTWEKRKLEIQLDALAQQPDADFAVTAALVWSQENQGYVRCAYDGPLDPDLMRAELLVRNILTGLCSSMLVRRRAIEAIGGFAGGKACEDRRIAIDLLAEHRALILPHPLVRQRPGPAHWTDPERHRREMLSLIEDYKPLYTRLDSTGRLKRRARARVHERSGMHYLENGDHTHAARDLFRATLLWPLMPNPWRVLINAFLGRLNTRPLRQG